MASHTANSTESDTRTVVFRIWRGDVNGGQYVVYPVEVTQGMVVLDCVHKIQAE
jgi:succinate dehydrogenase/fumarate reductase-like Fe-S protein